MKLMKKISAVLLSICLLVPCFSMVASAAHGRISFTDPSTAVGEYVEVKCVLRSTSGNMGNVEVDLKYDDAYLRFESGSGITADGNGALTCSGSANAAEVSFVAKFQALQEGTTKVEVTGTTISDVNGLALTLDQGNSTVTIAAGDPSLITDGAAAAPASDLQVDVNGVTYTLTDEFADADIPNGYARTRRTLEGEERQMVENDNGSVCLGYMRDAEGNGDFFLYNEENATFSPYAEISISDTTSIIVLSDASQVTLPNHYQEAKLSLNEKEFPVWQNTEKEGIYVLYAMNSNGEIGFYQYDSAEGTYQRFEPGQVEEAEEATGSDSFLGKVEDFVKGHLSLVVLAVGLGGIFGLILLLVLAIKLHRRNAEIDELYEEYGIDFEDEEPAPAPVKKEKETKKKRKQKVEEPEEDFEEVDFEEDFEEADLEEADFEEDFSEDFEEVDLEADFEETDFEDYREEEFVPANKPAEEFTGYTERMDFTIDDLDELLGEKSEKKRGHVEEDDTFKVDFIDLD